jgi:hypothetical protein
MSIDVISVDTLCAIGTTATAAPASRATGRKQSPQLYRGDVASTFAANGVKSTGE